VCSLLRRFREGGRDGCCIIKRGIDAYCLNDWAKSRSEVRMHLSTVGCPYIDRTVLAPSL
jgi:hypothetical protein